MGINIKNPAIEGRIRELAKLTGKGQTEVIGEAIDMMLAREKRRGLAERLTAIADEMAPRFKPPYDKIDHAELLYDEKTGLPK
jgi:hypothetical protein